MLVWPVVASSSAVGGPSVLYRYYSNCLTVSSALFYFKFASPFLRMLWGRGFVFCVFVFVWRHASRNE